MSDDHKAIDEMIEELQKLKKDRAAGSATLALHSLAGGGRTTIIGFGHTALQMYTLEIAKRDLLENSAPKKTAGPETYFPDLHKN